MGSSGRRGLSAAKASLPASSPSLIPLLVLSLLVVTPAIVSAYEIRINCAGEFVAGRDGDFMADQAWTPEDPIGFTESDIVREANAPVGGTLDPELHAEARGNWTYRFDGLEPGPVIIELLFSEIRYNGPGEAIFDVVAGDETLIGGLDIFAEAGMKGYAIRYRVPLNISGTQFLVQSQRQRRTSALAAISVWSREADDIAPAAPESVTALDGFEEVLLHWTDVTEDDVAGYRLYRRPTTGGEAIRVGPETIRRVRHIDTDVTIGETYDYWVTAVDVFGNEGSPSATVRATALPRDDSRLPIYEITISDIAWLELNVNILQDIRVPATFTAEGENHAAEVGYRGAITRKMPKKSWKVAAPGVGLAHGRDVLNLNAMMVDRTLIREPLAYDFLARCGVHAPDAEPIQLFVNGRYFGVYASVEDVNRDFLERVELDSDGNLYRAFDSLERLPDTATYMEAYDKKTNEDDGYDDIITLIELIDDTPDSALYETLLPIFDFERLYDYYAANVVLSNIDFGRDDYYLHHDLDTGIWTWLPWDYNEALGVLVFWSPWLHASTPVFPGLENRLIAKLHDNVHFNRRHLDRVRQLMDTVFTESAMGEASHAAHERIAESGRVDWRKWGWEDNSGFDQGADEIGRFVTLRRAFLEGEIPRMLERFTEPSLVINEILAVNDTTIADAYGEHDDWVELYNATDDALDLSGFHLTDDEANQTKWSLPDTTIAPGAHLLVWCEGDTLQGPLHANFRLGAAGEFVGIFGPAAEGNRVVDTKTFPAAISDVAFGREPDGSYAWRHLPTPTPGAPNVPWGNIVPQFIETVRDPLAPTVGDTIWVATEVWDDTGIVDVTLWADAGSGFTDTAMEDDGSHHDRAAGDGRYGAGIVTPPGTTVIHYYVAARDDSGGVATDPRDSPEDAYVAPVGYALPPLVVNEFLAINDNVNADEAGEYDDWIELYNSGDDSITVGGMHLTDDLTRPTAWRLPDTTIAPGAHLLVWCDNRPEQGALHATFRLSGSGEAIGLFETEANGHVPIDTLSYGPQAANRSAGRTEDGGDTWVVFSTPTPGGPNDPSGSVPERIRLAQSFPNPAKQIVTIPFGLSRRAHVRLDIYDVAGRRVRRLVDRALEEGNHNAPWNGRDERGRRMAAGVYFYRLNAEGRVLTSKMLITR